jgi:hypothetical protein
MAETTENYLGRCETKGCDYAVFATPESIANVATFNEVQPGGVYRVDSGPRVFSRCPTHRRTVMLSKVKGTYSDKHTCDSRCLNARGHDCTCSCGGVNHGRGYAITAPVTATNAQVAQTIRDGFTEGVVMPTEWTSAAPAPMPEPGATIRSEVRCTRVTHNVGDYSATLFTFVTETGRTLKWFAPDYLGNAFEAGEEATIRAKVKRINEWNGRIEAIVTHVEKIEE